MLCEVCFERLHSECLYLEEKHTKQLFNKQDT